MTVQIRQMDSTSTSDSVSPIGYRGLEPAKCGTWVASIGPDHGDDEQSEQESQLHELAESWSLSADEERVMAFSFADSPAIPSSLSICSRQRL